LVDVPAALANFTSPEPTINVTLRLDTRGHLATSNAVLYSAAPESESGGVAGALKGLFGKKDKVETEETEEGEGEAGAESNKTVSAKAGKKEKVAIKFKEKFLGVKPMSGEEKRNTQARYVPLPSSSTHDMADDRLKSISTFESAKHSREEARNVLEGYLYRLQALLADDAENTAIHDFAKKDEKARLKKSLGETFDWLQDNAESADEVTLREKRQALLYVSSTSRI
jgi:hypoxia up-regulated 1